MSIAGIRQQMPQPDRCQAAVTTSSYRLVSWLAHHACASNAWIDVILKYTFWICRRSLFDCELNSKLAPVALIFRCPIDIHGQQCTGDRCDTFKLLAKLLTCITTAIQRFCLISVVS